MTCDKAFVAPSAFLSNSVTINLYKRLSVDLIENAARMTVLRLGRIGELPNDICMPGVMFDEAKNSSGSGSQSDQARPWNAGTDALARLRLGDSTSVSSDN